MRHGLLRASALIAMLLSGCGSTDGPGTPSQQPVAIAIGIVYVGGPAPGYSGHLVPGTILLRGLGTGASREVADGQAATFRVQPGEYTATARSRDAQCHPTEVRATAGTTAPFLVRCEVK